jgi:5-methylcytosine-specific restriction endonuclease McrA
MYKNKKDKIKYSKKYYQEHKHKCLKCDNMISGKSKLCHSCAAIEHWNECPEHKEIQSKNVSGINNPMAGKVPWNYKGIEKKCKCKDCGNKISKTTYYRGKRCLSCAAKRKVKLGITCKKGDNVLENNKNWQGGISKLPYAPNWNDQLKETIRTRDNYTCQNCGMTEEEHIILYLRNLLIHHIDYNKKNCVETNLITTCNQCNSRANFNKEYWINLYTDKINIIYQKS